ncbi:MAG: polyphosphate kinase 2 family protein [Acidimicrobiales bacterium]|nr:polyphosphate kinase 2 family protein [Acidimicrobiales bacterium]
MNTSIYRVRRGTKVRLQSWPTDDSTKFGGTKSTAKATLTELNLRLAELQQMLYAQAERRVLIVLQGMDTSGKDGTIKHVFRSINPLGVSAVNFKRPTEQELARDYLWRIHQHVPPRGHITIFNRSHYEDVLVVRVHGLVPESVWSKRYDHICDFERMLADEGTVIRKFFLHISKEEQKRRLQERLENPSKRWKFEHGDVEERKRWDSYQEAYEAVLSTTSQEFAPWYIVPSDKKWYRNLVISTTLIETLESMELRYPSVPGLAGICIE